MYVGVICNYCSPREKVVKFLQSNPVQILLCVIVLLDAVIVITQILLDLNSVKGQLVHTILFSVPRHISQSYSLNVVLQYIHCI